MVQSGCTSQSVRKALLIKHDFRPVQQHAVADRSQKNNAASLRLISVSIISIRCSGSTETASTDTFRGAARYSISSTLIQSTATCDFDKNHLIDDSRNRQHAIPFVYRLSWARRAETERQLSIVSHPSGLLFPQNPWIFADAIALGYSDPPGQVNGWLCRRCSIAVLWERSCPIGRIDRVSKRLSLCEVQFQQEVDCLRPRGNFR